ncbi:MAG: AAA family ATPase [Blastocatellia bacterium]|nr:AAA family ATPase [Blastocatellia bacterium]
MKLQDLTNLSRIDLFERLQTTDYLQAMAKCQQDPFWHAEGSVLTHTQMVMDAVVELLQNSALEEHTRQAVYIAALLHDAGKPSTTVQAVDGHIVAPFHSQAAIALARHVMFELGVEYKIRQQAINLILYHTIAPKIVRKYPAELTVNNINLEQKKYRRLSSEVELRSLYYLTKANWLGRISKKRKEVLREIEIFKSRALFYKLWEKQFEGILSNESIAKLSGDPKEQLRIKHALKLLVLNGKIVTEEDLFKYIEENPSFIKPTTAHLYLTIGIPGVGKSSWITANLPGIRVISSDIKRVELFGNINSQEDNQRVFEECFLDIERSLKNCQAVILDATNVKIEQRSRFLLLAKQLQAHTTIIYFDQPLEVALERNQKRERQVPEEAIRNYFDNLMPPSANEAAEIIVVTTNSNGSRS